MKKSILFFFISFFSFSTYALDITKACNEEKEQKRSLSNLSTSMSEAFLAGQCIGYRETSKFNREFFSELSIACGEYIERKESLLPMEVSTTLSEAMQSGMCIGAIYQVAQSCDRSNVYINYSSIARLVRQTHGENTLNVIEKGLSCW